MQVFFNIVSLLLVAGTLTLALKRPSYMEPCSASDPNLNDCIVKNGNNVIKQLINGEKSLKIPPLNPLHLDEAILEPGTSLKLTLKNFDVHGLDNMEIKKSDSDIGAKHLGLKLKTPILQLEGDYEVSGKILVLPIDGHGPINLTIVDPDVEYNLYYDLETIDGIEYMKLKDQDLSYKPTKVYYRLDNLFNGNEKLGEEMNKFLNENWESINKELSTSISKTVLAIIEIIMKDFMKIIPYNEIVLK